MARAGNTGSLGNLTDRAPLIPEKIKRKPHLLHHSVSRSISGQSLRSAEVTVFALPWSTFAILYRHFRVIGIVVKVGTFWDWIVACLCRGDELHRALLPSEMRWHTLDGPGKRDQVARMTAMGKSL
jgi:hypothetical protein